ncbi:MAG: acylneuraminate cytidylyltransferase [Kiritimatiellaceae bacterium]|nr:acylneuraminate cytidylyltransferase [Kiritimatiellaceae bacterium]
MTNQTDNRVVAFIPVRGGSKSIPLKNIKKIAGKPLVQWTLEAAAAAKCIDAVYLATDSAEIRTIVEGLHIPKVTVMGRSPETATDQASTESALLEFCENQLFSHVYLIQATSPLLTAKDLDDAWQAYRNSDDDAVLSVVRQKRFLWESTADGVRPVNYDPASRPRRQDFDGHLVENGAFYVSSRERVLSSQCRISGRIGLYEMAEESYFEIDEPSDWVIVEGLLKRSSAYSPPNLSNIQMLVMDCDGVLTDAGMYYGEHGEAFKKFNTRDGKGVELLRKAGLKTALLTGEDTPPAKRRAEKLQIDYVITGATDKAKDLQKLSELSGVDPAQMAYIGDDINDLPAIALCGFSACPGDAMSAVKAEVDVVLDVKGGDGAVRAFADLILKHV